MKIVKGAGAMVKARGKIKNGLYVLERNTVVGTTVISVLQKISK